MKILKLIEDHHIPVKQRLQKIVGNPWLQLSCGTILFISSIWGQQGLYDDLTHFNISIHHGAAVMGLWQILQSLPNLMSSIIWLLGKYATRSKDNESDSND